MITWNFFLISITNLPSRETLSSTHSVRKRRSRRRLCTRPIPSQRLATTRDGNKHPRANPIGPEVKIKKTRMPLPFFVFSRGRGFDSRYVPSVHVSLTHTHTDLFGLYGHREANRALMHHWSSTSSSFPLHLRSWVRFPLTPVRLCIDHTIHLCSFELNERKKP